MIFQRDIFIKTAFWMLVVVMAPHPAVYGQSLYEKYTMASKSDLEAETREMGKKLTETFNAAAINQKRQQIDFAKYYSNLKKLVIYGAKMAKYSEYEKDLRFARDNEVFKGLPENPADLKNGDFPIDRKHFVETKYTRMKKNVEEEIATYHNLMLISLDVCEYLTEYDLSHLLGFPQYTEKIENYTRSKEYQKFQAARERLSYRWPKLERRISAQLSLWVVKPASPDTPLISTTVTGEL